MSQQGTAAWRNDDSSGSDSGDPRVVAAMHEYMTALESGHPPVRKDFLARHAEIAAELTHCLDGLELVNRTALDLQHPEDESPDADEQARTPLGDFRIVREIGRGGMGIVYEAIQLSLGRRVALKVLPFVASLDPTRLQRFKNEAQAAAQLHHTNIVPVYAVGSRRGVHYYAMQLMYGK
jgi:serine/threonine protein kinase